MFPSSVRTISPSVIDCGGRASVKPPPTPRWVEIKPPSAIPHYLGQMIAGDAELGRDFAGRERARRLAGKPHQGAHREIRERRQTHGSPLENRTLRISHISLNRYLKYLFKETCRDSS